jgi:undecaprenyl-diphosphatase
MTVFNLGRLTGNDSAVRRAAANIAQALVVLTRPARPNAPALWRPSPQQVAAGAGVAIVMFVVLMFLIDGAVIRAVGTMPRWVIWSFDAITDYGKSGWWLWPLGILFILLCGVPPSLSRSAQLVTAAIAVRVGFVFVAIAVPGLVTTAIKHVFGRARPGVGGSLDPFLFSPFNWSAAYASLPSGHVTTVASALVACGILWPRLRPVLWVYAILITLSRFMVTAHYPTDALGGAIVGAGGALLVRHYFALRGLGFSYDADGQVHTLAGPSLRRIKSVARELLSQ